MARRLCLLVVVLAAIGQAAWPRLVISRGGPDKVDRPPAHSWEYFTRYPMLRDEEGSFCVGCSPEKRLAAAKKSHMTTEWSLVGTVRGLPVYDLFYRYGDDRELDQRDWKSVLVQVGPDLYQEIYHDQPTEGSAQPSFLITVSGATLLGVSDNGYKRDGEEHYFWFDPDGVSEVNFEALWDAATEAIPEDRYLDTYVLYSYLPRGFVPFRLLMQEEDRCCGKGIVTVRFRLEKGQVVVTGTEFDPNAEHLPK